MARAVVGGEFSSAGMHIDRDSRSNLVVARAGNMFTGIMDMRDKTLYFGPLAKPAEHDHYGTVAPLYTCRVRGAVIAPIVHSSALTSHAQLAQFVIGRLGHGTEDDFCGFALRFEEGARAALAPTSRTLNPGYNGQLEDVILDALYLYLRPKLQLLGVTLAKAGARITPDQAQAARGGVVIPRGLLAGIQGLKKK